ncbi:hypothetical protein AFK24_24230 [Pseudomonas syringae]|uniref:Alpha/beta hydrolase n=1 Tax=Pseudomonas syringae TaxID=317 RepID=A0A1C7YX24_PSESX|nr:alpha/beta hydrolase [Pseudomonas syringae]OCR22231.1 hypothetical protein AFK24_24230 [Pseudomonas syringae]
MQTEIRVLILPGRGNSGDKHWQSFWERSHSYCRRVLQRDWENPHIDEWVETLEQAITEEDFPTILVAHSLSVAQVAHWALRHAAPPYNGCVRGALLVAPSDVEDPSYPPGAIGFAPMPSMKLPFPSTVVTSTNDTRVTLARARQFATDWGSSLQVPGAFGHLGSFAELGDWPYGYSLLQALIEQA